MPPANACSRPGRDDTLEDVTKSGLERGPGARAREVGLEIITEAGTRLASTLDPETIAEHVTVLLVPRLAAWCAVAVAAEGGTITRTLHAERAQTAVVDALLGAPTLSEIRTPRRPRQVDDLAGLAADPEERDQLRQIGACAAVVPLVPDDPRAGAILVGDRRPFEAADLATLESVAQLARLASANARMFTRLQRAVAARDDLLALIGHDLRDPLETIAGHAALLGDPAADGGGPELRRRVDAIRRSAATMQRVVADVVELDRLDHGRVVLDRGHLDARVIVRDAVAAAEQAALAHGVTVRVVEPAGELAVHWDRDRIAHAVGSLIGHAIASSPRGGAVVVTAEARGADRVALAVTASAHAIPPDPRRRGPHDGPGLALAIVKGLTEAHGGAVEIAGSPADGARFTLTLPRGAAPRVAAAAPPGRRVLVVDDDRAIRDEIADLLANAGYEVAVAADGEDALARLRDMAPPSVILLDVMMPRLDAVGFCRAKQRHPALADIPVVVFSAYANLGSVATEVGAAASLEKPLRAAKLLETVRKVAPVA